MISSIFRSRPLGARLALLLLLVASSGVAAGPARLHTPPMGWNSWNAFGCDVSRISHDSILAIGKALVKNGLADVGYSFVNLDDCWTDKKQRRKAGRNAEETLRPNPSHFPGGISKLAGELQALGLELGIYADAGTNTCQAFPGSIGFESTDAHAFSRWGVSYVKLDGCYASPSAVRRSTGVWAASLSACQRPVVLSCSWPAYAPAVAESLRAKDLKENCDLWRFYGDIANNWASLRAILNFCAEHQDTLVFAAMPQLAVIRNFEDTRERVGEKELKQTNAFIRPQPTPEPAGSFGELEGIESGAQFRHQTVDDRHEEEEEEEADGKDDGKSSSKVGYEVTSGVNDPDMLEVGNGVLTEEEEKTHLALWCIMKAPIILGNDVTKLKPSTKEVSGERRKKRGKEKEKMGRGEKSKGKAEEKKKTRKDV
eukprot:GHVT01102616.1.p1 GENE.GHVT01102616.1~~GHVT01102616.1.p1  ORF type:complete len:427 (+),score=88.48 GHVT01102616.1:168-1448(+)